MNDPIVHADLTSALRAAKEAMLKPQAKRPHVIMMAPEVLIAIDDLRRAVAIYEASGYLPEFVRAKAGRAR